MPPLLPSPDFLPLFFCRCQIGSILRWGAPGGRGWQVIPRSLLFSERSPQGLGLDIRCFSFRHFRHATGQEAASHHAAEPPQPANACFLLFCRHDRRIFGLPVASRRRRQPTCSRWEYAPLMTPAATGGMGRFFFLLSLSRHHFFIC